MLDLDWETEAYWYAGPSHDARKHRKRKVRPWDGAYEAR